MQPLLEVFGHPVDDGSDSAVQCRKHRLCPFGNSVPNCTKDKADDPLGVCSIRARDGDAIICPVRFRQDWLIARQAAEFFFPEGSAWTGLTEVRLRDAAGMRAGNIDLLLVSYDGSGRVVDFGALEIQSVYISGNIRRVFEFYMGNQALGGAFDWSHELHYPRPDYLSSTKRLAPQLMFKGGILNAWGKKLAVALDAGFVDSLPSLRPVDPSVSDLVWLVYKLVAEDQRPGLALQLVDRVYTSFETCLDEITRPKPGSVEDFLAVIQERLASVTPGGDLANRVVERFEDSDETEDTE